VTLDTKTIIAGVIALIVLGLSIFIIQKYGLTGLLTFMILGPAAPILILFALVLLMYVFMTFVWPIIDKWLKEIRLENEFQLRKKESLKAKTNKYMSKHLEIRFGSSGVHKASFGTIMGWNQWKPTYLYYSEDFKDPVKFTKNKPPVYEILYYKPEGQGFFSALNGGTDTLMFEPDQVKFIDETRVVLQGDGIETCITGYPVLSKTTTPMKEVALAMEAERFLTILSSMIFNQKKISDHALNLNPIQQAHLQLGTPSIDVPVPQAPAKQPGAP